MSERFVPVRDSRVEVRRDPDGVRVAVPRRRTFWQVLVPLWALFVIGFGLVMMLTGDSPEPWPIGFMVLWVGIGLFIVGTSSWGLFAREELRLTPRALVQERRLGPVARRRAYDRMRIENLRVSAESIGWFDPRAAWRMYGIGGGTIAFDYGDRTMHVGQAEEAEARRIVEALGREGL
jgi:hypothetical protein